MCRIFSFSKGIFSFCFYAYIDSIVKESDRTLVGRKDTEESRNDCRSSDSNLGSLHFMKWF